MSRVTIAVQHVRAALSGARRLGIDTVPLLQAARIPPLLLGDDRARVTPEQFTRLITGLQRATRDEFLGLGPVPSRPGTFAMLCHTCLGCPDLGAALDRAVRFYGLFPGGPEMAVETSAEGEAVFRIRTDLCAYEEGPFLSECVLVVWHRLSSWLIGRRLPLRWAGFVYPAPVYAREYDVLFGCPVRFRAPSTGAGWDARWLSAPVVQDEAALRDMLRRAPADLISRPAYGTTVAEHVRHTLVRALRAGGPARLPELTEVAARLSVSPATLRRRLQEEETSYQQLKDAVRRDAAITSLVAGREPITELAVRLGYSEDTAFHRAFRRWTGTTPGAYRLRAAPARSARSARTARTARPSESPYHPPGLEVPGQQS
ncbi:AraC family transcriptional regulator [Streptomyces sp. MST-110588]|uniref:AraC family transcriptional regulator n=1 Tax=Streptomyces sp. MST-110588 TaxID=2833628 RepID=UPI001F5C66FD|nr:AraC family transcriptional regulator [Streptomyces sp. MST-110588]UNO41266.1 AraC family transcriptional regulator [Streptomyces sp. MST-110588]